MKLSDRAEECGWRNCLVKESTTIAEVMRAIEISSMQISMVVDEDLHLRGIITDGDIRRWILKEGSLACPAVDIMNRNPLVFHLHDSRNFVIQQMQVHGVNHAPLLDSDEKIIDLYILNNLLAKKRRENKIVLMAGGLGVRLRPLTDNIPKPLLKIGNKPILETILDNFIEGGFYHFYLAVNYKSEMIEEYFGDGSRWNVSIEYLREKKRLGTAGALYLLGDRLTEPFIVMNGDLLTKVDFGSFLEWHIRERAVATMGVREYSWQIPYGVLELDGTQILSVREKPVYQCYVNAGMYVLSPEAVHYIPEEQYFDMPDLFRKIIADKKKASVYPVRDYWMDIGQVDDFHQAQGDYPLVFGGEK